MLSNLETLKIKSFNYCIVVIGKIVSLIIKLYLSPLNA